LLFHLIQLGQLRLFLPLEQGALQAGHADIDGIHNHSPLFNDFF
jgi:hypothetical protein